MAEKRKSPPRLKPLSKEEEREQRKRIGLPPEPKKAQTRRRPDRRFKAE